MTRPQEILQRSLPAFLAVMLLLVGFPAKQSCCCVAKAERMAAVERSTGSCCSQSGEQQQAPESCEDCECRLDAAPQVPMGLTFESAPSPALAFWLGSSRPLFEAAVEPSPRRAYVLAARDRAPPGPLYLRLCSFRC